MSADAAAPRIFNAPGAVTPGDVISLQGANFDSSSVVYLASATGAAVPLSVVNRVDTRQLSVSVPASWTGGLIAWVTNARGASNAVRLNGAVAVHLDATQLVPGGAFRILGRGLLQPGYTPTVTVNGMAATLNASASNPNLLVVTAPAQLTQSASATVLVDNGNGTGSARLDRPVSVVAGTGDAFSLGVGWGAGFDFASRVIQVSTPCNGASDDSGNIQNAINNAAGAGGVVQLPSGTCVLNNGLGLRSRVVLKGAGKDATVLRYNSNYPVSALDLDLVGLQDLSLVNSGPVQEGTIWKHNTRSFFLRVRIDQGVSRQMYFTDNVNFVVTQTDFIQRGSIGGQNPYLFSNSSGLAFTRNTTLSADGSPTFQGVHDSVFIGNRFTRDASHQNESQVIAHHRFVMDFAYRVSVLDNIMDVTNGTITNTLRNDGETFLTEGGGASRTENLGTVTSATSTSVTDAGNTFNFNPFGTGLPENYGVAIIDGKGAGQTRDVVGFSGNTLNVDHAWEVVPDSTSHYATFVWGLQKALIKGNTLAGNPRGIWLYQTAIRDVDILDNQISNGGGIFLRTYQSLASRQFTPIYNVRIAGNRISNSNGLWMSYINVVFVNKDPSPFGIASTGIEIRNNTLTANVPNVSSSIEDYAGGEGYVNVMRSEPPSGQLNGTPPLLATAFQGNQCINCSTAFIIGTGAYGTTLIDNQPGISSPAFLADWHTLGASVPASIGTLAR
jgi:hypothetical protein